MKKGEQQYDEGDLHCAEAHKIRNELENNEITTVWEKARIINAHTFGCQECIQLHELYNDHRAYLAKIRWKYKEEILDYLDYLYTCKEIEPYIKARARDRGDWIDEEDDRIEKEEENNSDDLAPAMILETIQSLVDDWRKENKIFIAIIRHVAEWEKN